MYNGLFLCYLIYQFLSKCIIYINGGIYYAGFYNCLINCGLSTQDAYELTMNESTSRNNLKLQELVNEGSVDVAKIQDEKQSI